MLRGPAPRWHTIEAATRVQRRRGRNFPGECPATPSLAEKRRPARTGDPGKPLSFVESPELPLASACLFPHLLGNVGRIHEVERVRQAHGRFGCSGQGRLRWRRGSRGRGAFRALRVRVGQWRQRQRHRLGRHGIVVPRKGRRLGGFCHAGRIEPGERLLEAAGIPGVQGFLAATIGAQKLLAPAASSGTGRGDGLCPPGGRCLQRRPGSASATRSANPACRSQRTSCPGFLAGSACIAPPSARGSPLASCRPEPPPGRSATPRSRSRRRSARSAGAAAYRRDAKRPPGGGSRDGPADRASVDAGALSVSQRLVGPSRPA